MSDTTFTYKSTQITNEWANQINRYVFSAATASAIRTLGTPSAVTGQRVYTRVRTLGYYTPGDGGSGDYWFDPSDTTSADNGGTVFVDTVNGRWKLSNPLSVSVKQFGAKGDGVTDDTAAINAALTAVDWVFVPPDCASVISSTIVVGVNKRLTFLCGLGQSPTSRFIKSAGMTTVGMTVDAGGIVEGGGIGAAGGDTGGGLQIIGNGAKVRDFVVNGVGGDAFRVGTTGGANCNSFELDHCIAKSPTGIGFYIHDGKAAVGPDCNAGTLRQCFAQLAGSDGFRLGHCWYVKMDNCLAESCTGYGWQTSSTINGTVPECRYASIADGDFNESNTAGVCLDGGYRSSVRNADSHQLPVTAANVTSGSGQRSIFATFGTQFWGGTVYTIDASALFTVDDGTAGDLTYPIHFAKKTSGGNGQGFGLKWTLDDGNGSVDAGAIDVQQSTTAVWSMFFYGYYGGAKTAMMVIDANALTVRPAATNTLSCGSSTRLWTAVWATNGTIQTSDETLKKDVRPLDVQELAVAARLKGLVRTFRWKEGDVKLHTGVLAQEVVSAFRSEGLDALSYGIVTCGEDGLLAVTYTELLAFIIAAL